MARKLGSKDKQQRKRQIMRNIQAVGRNALTGASLGGAYGILIPMATGNQASAKTFLKGAAIGAPAFAGLSEIGYRTGKDIRKKAGYGHADRLDIIENAPKYVEMLRKYELKEQRKRDKFR